jgi:hypothetical protein
MTAPKRERITGLGYDENFGGIDLSGCPSAQGIPKDQNFVDERFAPLDATGSGHGSNALKEFLRQQTAEQEGPSVVHVSGQPFKIQFHEHTWHGEGTLNGQRHRFTADDRDQLIGKLVSLAKEEVIHDLTRAEQLQIIRMCQNGQKYEAIDTYLKLALGQSRYADDDQISNPELLPLMNTVAEFTWFHSTPEAQDADEWHTFKEEFLNGRPLTHDLLDAAFAAFQAHRKQNRYTLFAPEREEPEVANPNEVAAALENLSDDGVVRMYQATARELAQSHRR